eukprot:13153570-Alexandrium_andersonii.AAC.1
MSASLVGSEMCIRDRRAWRVVWTLASRGGRVAAWLVGARPCIRRARSGSHAGPCDKPSAP